VREEANGNTNNKETVEGYAAQPEIMAIGYSFATSAHDYYCCGVGGYPPVTRWDFRDSRRSVGRWKHKIASCWSIVSVTTKPPTVPKKQWQLGRYIQNVRKTQGLTQEQLAAKIGTSRPWIGHLRPVGKCQISPCFRK
jgi:hypothetical protein